MLIELLALSLLDSPKLSPLFQSQPDQCILRFVLLSKLMWNSASRTLLRTGCPKGSHRNFSAS